MVLNLQKDWEEYNISIYPTPYLVNFPLSRGLSPSVYRYFMVLPVLKQDENIFSLHTNLQCLFHCTLPLHSKTTIIYLHGKWSFLLPPHYLCNPLCPHGSLTGVRQSHKSSMLTSLLVASLSSSHSTSVFSWSLLPSWKPLSLASVIPHLLTSLVVFLQSLFPATLAVLALWRLVYLWVWSRAFYSPLPQCPGYLFYFRDLSTLYAVIHSHIGISSPHF